MKIISNIKWALRFTKHFIVSENFELKYTLTMYSIAAVHAFLVILFSIFQVFPLIVFNIGSVTIYLCCIYLIKHRPNKPLLQTFYITYLEIIIHSFVATICIGWHFGFPQYIIGLIPFGYYMCVTMINNNKKYVIATVLGLIAAFSFFGCYIISTLIGSAYHLTVSPVVEMSIYIFNAICNFFLIFLFTLIFVIDMQLATNKLRSQNIILDHLASTDPMTGLYNRRSMQVFLEHAVESKEDFCLVMCDIDNFKKVNDRYGHDFGDVVIKDIANIIQQEVGDYGNVCRWGGEEILILCKRQPENTLQISENIRRNIEKHIFRYRDKTLHCTITLGISRHRKDDAIEDTIKNADDQLYYGKRNGKNQVIFS